MYTILVFCTQICYWAHSIKKAFSLKLMQCWYKMLWDWWKPMQYENKLQKLNKCTFVALLQVCVQNAHWIISTFNLGISAEFYVSSSEVSSRNLSLWFLGRLGHTVKCRWFVPGQSITCVLVAVLIHLARGLWQTGFCTVLYKLNTVCCVQEVLSCMSWHSTWLLLGYLCGRKMGRIDEWVHPCICQHESAHHIRLDIQRRCLFLPGLGDMNLTSLRTLVSFKTYVNSGALKHTGNCLKFIKSKSFTKVSLVPKVMQKDLESTEVALYIVVCVEYRKVWQQKKKQCRVCWAHTEGVHWRVLIRGSAVTPFLLVKAFPTSRHFLAFIKRNLCSVLRWSLEHLTSRTWVNRRAKGEHS